MLQAILQPRKATVQPSTENLNLSSRAVVKNSEDAANGRRTTPTAARVSRAYNGVASAAGEPVDHSLHADQATQKQPWRVLDDGDHNNLYFSSPTRTPASAPGGPAIPCAYSLRQRHLPVSEDGVYHLVLDNRGRTLHGGGGRGQSERSGDLDAEFEGGGQNAAIRESKRY